MSIFDRNDYRELAEHSAGFRAVWLRLVLGDPGRVDIGQAQHLLEQQANEVRARLGLPVTRRNAPVFLHEPRNMREALDWLRRPEAWTWRFAEKRQYLRTPNFSNMRLHAERDDPGLAHVHEKIKRELLPRLYRHCDFVSVPVFVLRIYEEPKAQQHLYDAGLVTVKPQENPYCHGRAFTLGHYAEREFRGWCLAWMNATVQLAAREVDCSVAWSPSAPGEYVLGDQHGVIPDLGEEPFPIHSGTEERDRLIDYYVQGSPWRGPPGGSALDPALWEGRDGEESESGDDGDDRGV